jgi:hypothetical protein
MHPLAVLAQRVERAERSELRDRFAMQALAGLVQGDVPGAAKWPEEWAVLAYKIADAMLAERER